MGNASQAADGDQPLPEPHEDVLVQSIFAFPVQGPLYGAVIPAAKILHRLLWNCEPYAVRRAHPTNVDHLARHICQRAQLGGFCQSLTLYWSTQSLFIAKVENSAISFFAENSRASTTRCKAYYVHPSPREIN